MSEENLVIYFCDSRCVTFLLIDLFIICIDCTELIFTVCAAKKLPKTDPAASSANQQQRGVNLRGDEAPPSSTGCCN